MLTVVAMVAVVGIDAELVDDLEGVFGCKWTLHPGLAWVAGSVLQ